MHLSPRYESLPAHLLRMAVRFSLALSRSVFFSLLCQTFLAAPSISFCSLSQFFLHSCTLTHIKYVQLFGESHYHTWPLQMEVSACVLPLLNAAAATDLCSLTHWDQCWYGINCSSFRCCICLWTTNVAGSPNWLTACAITQHKPSELTYFVADRDVIPPSGQQLSWSHNKMPVSVFFLQYQDWIAPVQWCFILQLHYFLVIQFGTNFKKNWERKICYFILISYDKFIIDF